MIPLSAELRMLKILQQGVNSRTKQVDKLAEGSRQRRNLAANTAKKQGRVEELTRKLARKLQKEDDPEGGKDR